MVKTVLTSQEVRKILNIDEASLRRLRLCEKFPFKKKNKKYSYKLEDINNYKQFLQKPISEKSIQSYPYSVISKWRVHPAAYVRKVLREARIILPS